MENEAEKPRKKSKAPAIVLVVGILALIAGAVLLTVKLVGKPAVADAEFLVEVGAWAREDEPEVIWEFTEVGKGILTTNAHTNDYDFIWALEGDKLKIETDWLYELEDEFGYKVDQGARKLALSAGEKNWTFVAAE